MIVGALDDEVTFESTPCSYPVGMMLGVPYVHHLVERFDRRGTEPFELFRSEFGQNSGASALKNSKNSGIMFNIL